MNQESVVYGYIKTANDIGASGGQASIVNRRALMHLPTQDTCALITRDMFSTPSLITGSDSTESTIIHFGYAYKGIEYEWQLWMSRFEDLLQKMYWDSVIVQLETELSGTHTFSWYSGECDHTPGNTPLNIRCEWQHELGLHGRRV